LRVCVADTVGYATPTGAAAVVRFVRGVVDECGGTGVEIDWHGHRDRDLAIINTLAALEAGATRVAVVRAVVGASDIEQATRALKQRLLRNQGVSPPGCTTSPSQRL